MAKRKSKSSVTEKILGLENFLKKPKTADEIKTELKDSLGHNINLTEIRKSLLRLLRRKKIKRKKEEDIYKYHTD